MIGESFIGQYRLSNRARHSILAVLSVLIVGALALAALSLREPGATDDSVRAGVSLPDPRPPTTETLTASTKAGAVSRFDPSVVPVSTSVSAEEAARRPARPSTTPPPPDREPEPTPTTDTEPIPSTEPDPTPSTDPDPEPTPPPTPTTEPDPEPTPLPTITIITLPDPTWITLPWPTHTISLPPTSVPGPTVETTAPVTSDTWDITLPTLPPETRPKPKPGR